MVSDYCTIINSSPSTNTIHQTSSDSVETSFMNTTTSVYLSSTEGYYS